ncbi:glycosyl hydrolase family 3 N-terminal domain protein [Clostridium sp. CAG:264]|nr:glycosyl hydrolase family 3 N-terminal domain protein [Clostridium sp. CAG:264]
MTDKIKTILEQMTIEEKADMVCGASNFCTADASRYGVPAIRMLDGGTGINYEQLIADLILSWRTNPRDEEEAWLMKDFSATEERNVIFDYFRPDKLTEKETKVWKKVREYLKEQFIKNTTNNDTTLAFVEMAGDAAADIMSPACFPCGMMLGATFNPDVVNQTGHALGREARAYGVSMLLGTPNINIHRDPLGGRLFEGFSEDPCLVAKLAPEYVKGVQAEGVAANIKHFAANNQEKNRQGINETISERALQEIYFPGFRACVEQAQPATVMAAYNKINGTACTANEWLLDGILRKYWGFEGMVVSDWGAVYDPIAALKAGNDLNMPGITADPEKVVQAVEAGELIEEELDRNVARVLELMDTYGSPECYDMSAQYIMDMSKQSAYKAACEGIVLLKNENGIFPIRSKGKAGNDSVFETVSDEEVMSGVVLCGSGAIRLYDCGTGSAGITTDKDSSIYEGLIQNGVEVSIGIPAVGKRAGISTYICVARIPGMEGNDRKNMKLSVEDAQILNQMLDLKRENPMVKLGLILNVSGPVDLALWEHELDGIFCMFLPGMEGGHAMADILTGRVNPSRKLPLTFPKKHKDTPTYLNFPGDGYQVNYGEGIYVGYRYYDKKMVEPLYPFGHGLSYSHFEISNERAIADSVPVELVYPDGKVDNKKMPVLTDSLRIAVDVINQGPEEFSEGMEVVQLYISDPYATISKPVKELKAFKKIRLAYGEREKVTFTLTKEDFASFDSDLHQWVAEEGVYNILIGNSSRNIVCSMPVYLDAKTEYSYSLQTPIKVLYENSVTKAHMNHLWFRLGLDPADIDNKYEYEPHTRLINLVHLKCENPEQEALDEFELRVGSLKRA